MGSMARQLIIDEEFRDLIPPLTPEEREGLEADILREGCLDALKVWRGEGGDVLLDGHNRHAVCERHGFPYEIEPIPGIENREDAKRWLINHQRHRRNLSEAQRSMLAGLLSSLNPGDNQFTTAPGGEVAQICATSQRKASELFNVSRRSVQHARKVHEKGVPELARLVTEGKASVSAAADVASLPAHEQREIVADGPVAIQTAARKMHQKKPAAPDGHPEPCPPDTPAASDPLAELLVSPSAASPTVQPVLPERIEEQLSAEGLRPCAQCGCAGTVKKEFDLLRGNLSYVICIGESCAMQTPLRKKPEEVIEVWNRRPSRT